MLLGPAQPASGDWFLVPAVGATFGSKITPAVDLDRAAGDSKLSLEGSVVWLGSQWLGVEGEVSYIGGFFENDDLRRNPRRLVTRSSVSTFTGSLLLAAPLHVTGNSLRPYGAVGFGLMLATIDDVSNLLPFEANLLAMRLGGGATGFLTDTVGVRWDLSHIRTLTGHCEQGGVAFDTCDVSFWRISMGAVLRF
jgi:hypothetical protein